MTQIEDQVKTKILTHSFAMKSIWGKSKPCFLISLNIRRDATVDALALTNTEEQEATH